MFFLSLVQLIIITQTLKFHWNFFFVNNFINNLEELIVFFYTPAYCIEYFKLKNYNSEKNFLMNNEI